MFKRAVDGIIRKVERRGQKGCHHSANPKVPRTTQETDLETIDLYPADEAIYLHGRLKQDPGAKLT